MKLALGTAQFGLDYGVANRRGKVSKSEVAEILLCAKHSGVEYIDTAISYGSSEEVLGSLGVNGFNVITKLPAIPIQFDNVHSWVCRQIQLSMDKLGVDSLYALLLHNPGDLFGKHGLDLVKSLEQIKSTGLVKKIGVSIYSPFDLQEIINKMTIDIVQAPINLIDRRLETSGWMRRLYNEGIEIHARSVFLQGLLLLNEKELPTNFYPWKGLWKSWHLALKKNQVSAISACLSYPFARKEINRVVIGVDSIAHFKQLINSAKSPLCSEDWIFMTSQDERLINPANWGDL